MVIRGLVGLFIAAASLVLIMIGENHYGSLKAHPTGWSWPCSFPAGPSRPRHHQVQVRPLPHGSRHRHARHGRKPWTKLMMMGEKAISVIVGILVVARAVNILK
jgi:hypothetical protein